MPPTLNDIARATHTSVSTVSRVLAGGPVAQRISVATRSRVRQTAERMGYKPNLLARGLRTRKSQTIALLVSDIANPFFGQIGSLIEQSLHGHGYSLVVCNSGEDAELEKEYLTLLPQKGIDGLILVPLVRTKKALYQFISSTMPLVVLDRPIPGVAASVWSDQEQLSQIVADALEQTGVRRIVLVTGPLDVVTHHRRADYMKRRFEVMRIHEGPAQKETGRLAAQRGTDELPDAYVCTNNFLGQGVIEGIGNMPNPPIIAMVDSLPLLDGLVTPVVTAIQDVPMLAESCVNLLLPQLNGDKTTAIKPIMLNSRLMTNAAFDRRR